MFLFLCAFQALYSNVFPKARSFFSTLTTGLRYPLLTLKINSVEIKFADTTMHPAGSVSFEMRTVCRHNQGHPESFLCSFSAVPSGLPLLPWRTTMWLPVPGNEGRPFQSVTSEGPGWLSAHGSPHGPLLVSPAHSPSLPGKTPHVDGLRLLICLLTRPLGCSLLWALHVCAEVCGHVCVGPGSPGTQQRLPSVGACAHTPTHGQWACGCSTSPPTLPVFIFLLFCPFPF